MTLATDWRSAGIRRAASRRLALAVLVSLVLNALLISAFVLMDRPTAFWSVHEAQEVGLRLSLVRSKPAAPPVEVRPARRRPQSPARPVPALPTLPDAPAPPQTQPAPASVAPPAPQPNADEANTRAQVATALRRMFACSRSDDAQARSDCAAQLAVRRDEEIDAVPAELRAKQAALEARRAYVESGAAQAQLPQGRFGNNPISASIHYECSMKLGVGASGKLHCPGVRQIVSSVQRLTK